MREVEDALVVRVRVDRGHEALLDRELVVQHLRERRDAVGRAGGVREHVVRFRVVGLVVDTEHDRHIRALGRRRDDHLLGAAVQMLRGPVAIGEEAGRLDYHVYAEIAPGEAAGVALRQDLDLLALDGDRPVACAHVLAELSQDGVVLEQVRHRGRVAEVVRRDDLEVPTALEVRAKEVAPDPPETVDPNPNSHCACPSLTRRVYRATTAGFGTIPVGQAGPVLSDFQPRGFSPSTCVILFYGGFALVRRWIQTPSVAKVRSATMRRGRSSSELPLRPAAAGGSGGPVGPQTGARAKPVRPLRSASQAMPWRPASYLPLPEAAAGRSGLRRAHGQSPYALYGRHRKRCLGGPPPTFRCRRQRRAGRASDGRTGKARTPFTVGIASDALAARLLPSAAGGSGGPVGPQTGARAKPVRPLRSASQAMPWRPASYLPLPEAAAGRSGLRRAHGQSPYALYGRHRKRCLGGPPPTFRCRRQRRAGRASDGRTGKARTPFTVGIASDALAARL